MEFLKLEDLTIEQKLGMVLCGRRFAQQADFDYTLELIKKKALGSVQVPCGPRALEIVNKIKEVAEYPILIIAEEEDLPLAFSESIKTVSASPTIAVFEGSSIVLGKIYSPLSNLKV